MEDEGPVERSLSEEEARAQLARIRSMWCVPAPPAGARPRPTKRTSMPFCLRSASWRPCRRPDPSAGPRRTLPSASLRGPVRPAGASRIGRARLSQSSRIIVTEFALSCPQGIRFRHVLHAFLRCAHIQRRDLRGASGGVGRGSRGRFGPVERRRGRLAVHPRGPAVGRDVEAVRSPGLRISGRVASPPACRLTLPSRAPPLAPHRRPHALAAPPQRSSHRLPHRTAPRPSPPAGMR